MPVYEEMAGFWGDWHSDVLIEPTGTYEEHQCLVHKIEMCTHSGTHIDAPKHFFKYGKSIDKIDLNYFITKAAVLDLTFIQEGQKIRHNRS